MIQSKENLKFARTVDKEAKLFQLAGYIGWRNSSKLSIDWCVCVFCKEEKTVQLLLFWCLRNDSYVHSNLQEPVDCDPLPSFTRVWGPWLSSLSKTHERHGQANIQWQQWDTAITRYISHKVQQLFNNFTSDIWLAHVPVSLVETRTMCVSQNASSQSYVYQPTYLHSSD